MNQNAQKIVSGFEDLLIRAGEQARILDEQIALLTGLRAALDAVTKATKPVVDKIKNGEILVADSVPESGETALNISIAGRPSTDLAKPTTPSNLSLGQVSEPMWKIIAEAMVAKPRFTMKEAGEALEGMLRRKLGKNRPQTVRNNLIRHPEVFRQNEDKTWSVINITADGINDNEVLEQ